MLRSYFRNMFIRRRRFQIPALFIVAIVLHSYTGCNKEITRKEVEKHPYYLAGGTTTTFVSDSTAYAQPLSNISKENLKKHYAGEIIFKKKFEPYSDVSNSGLGPLFIQDNCAACHRGNGRSQPPMSEVDFSSGLLMRMSVPGLGPHGEPQGVPGYGLQLQNRAMPGSQPEGIIKFTFEHFYETYPDGEKVLMNRPSRSLMNAYMPLPDGTMMSMRNASPIYGLGLLEAVSEEEILSRYEERDKNADNITGRPNYVWNSYTQQKDLGRFGWKGSHPSVIQQSAEAFQQDMGITSTHFFPEENGKGQVNCNSGFGSKPDVDSAFVAEVAFYIQTLAPPAPRNQDDPIVMRGRDLFMEINCSGCHTPKLTTGVHPIKELSNQTIYPYTDLLLHEMGEGIADARPDFDASTNEWRTPPLWGIGLTKIVNPNARFMHDGRAASLEEAILWHEGESYWVMLAYKQLPKEDRQAIIKFLESL